MGDGHKKLSSLVRCPDFRGCNIHRVFGARCVLVSSFQGVLIKGFFTFFKTLLHSVDKVQLVSRVSDEESSDV